MTTADFLTLLDERLARTVIPDQAFPDTHVCRGCSRRIGDEHTTVCVSAAAVRQIVR